MRSTISSTRSQRDGDGTITVSNTFCSAYRSTVAVSSKIHSDIAAICFVSGRNARAMAREPETAGACGAGSGNAGIVWPAVSPRSASVWMLI